MFVDIVARGGNLLLNVGPNGDGVVPLVQAQRLLALGWWLRTNGDAIYGTRPWTRPDGATADGLEARFTASDRALHAIVLGTPTNATVELLDVDVDDDALVEVLGHRAPLRWDATERGVRVQLPARPATGPAVTLRFSSPAGTPRVPAQARAPRSASPTTS